MDRAGLVAEGLVALRGERLVFGPLSFAVPPGGALVLLGPNGAGKSTLLRLLAGLGRIEAGTVRLAGAAIEPEDVGYLGHQDALKPGLTSAENLAFWGGPEAVGRALAALALAPLAPVPARMLSAGQKRRLALARLALSTAPLWLLDEPSLGLDQASVERLGALLAGHRNEGGMVIAATHLPLPLPGAAELRLG